MIQMVKAIDTKNQFRLNQLTSSFTMKDRENVTLIVKVWIDSWY